MASRVAVSQEELSYLIEDISRAVEEIRLLESRSSEVAPRLQARLEYIRSLRNPVRDEMDVLGEAGVILRRANFVLMRAKDLTMFILRSDLGEDASGVLEEIRLLEQELSALILVLRARMNHVERLLKPLDNEMDFLAGAEALVRRAFIVGEIAKQSARKGVRIASRLSKKLAASS